MANYPKKMKDPTEAALSAIQEALNIGDDEQTAARPEDMADLLSSAGDGRSGNAGAAPMYPESYDSDAIGTRDLAAAPPAANDDQQLIGQILHTLQRRPVRSSYFFATVFSCAWII